MAKAFENIAVSSKMREHIARRYPERGRFRKLEEDSGIPEWKWKNLFYKRQAVQQDQVTFWKSTYSDDELTSLPQEGLILTEAVKNAFSELDAAALALGEVKLDQVSGAIERLETARRVFRELFIQATLDGKAAR